MCVRTDAPTVWWPCAEHAMRAGAYSLAKCKPSIARYFLNHYSYGITGYILAIKGDNLPVLSMIVDNYDNRFVHKIYYLATKYNNERIKAWATRRRYPRAYEYKCMLMICNPNDDLIYDSAVHAHPVNVIRTVNARSADGVVYAVFQRYGRCLPRHYDVAPLNITT